MALTKDELLVALEALAARNVIARYLVAPAAYVTVQMPVGIDINCMNSSDALIEIIIARRG